MINNTKNEFSADYVKWIKRLQDSNYLNPSGIVSHVIDKFYNANISLSTREPEKMKKAEMILQKPNKCITNLQSQQNHSQDFQVAKNLDIIQYEMHKEQNNDQSNAMEQKNQIQETKVQENKGLNDEVQQKQNSFYQDTIINKCAYKSKQKLDKKQVKKEKLKYQKILHYYQTQLSKMEQQLLELAQNYTFLLNNEAINDILDIEDEDSLLFNGISKQQEQEMSNNQEFDEKQQTLSGLIQQQDHSSDRDFSQDQIISHDFNKNQKQLNYISLLQSDQCLKNIKIFDQSSINLTNKNAYLSQLDINQTSFINKKQQNITRSEDQIFKLKTIFQQYIEDIKKYTCSKKIKINGKSYAVFVVDSKKVIEKSMQQSKRLFKNINNIYIFAILRLKQIKKCLIQKQDECLERLDELFKVNFWPKEYKYTREKGSKEKQKQIQDEIEKNKPLLYQNKQLLLDISKKKFEMKKENPQKKREIQKLENYLIKRHQDERKLSKKLQLHNQMKNFIMYSIRYVADNIAYDDPEDVNRQKKILKYFHLAYNKSDLQALVSPQAPYTIQNIQNIISLDNQKAQFKYNQFFDYQKQMISQYSQYLLEQNTENNDDKQIQVINITWEDLLNYPNILEKFNAEIIRLNMFNKSNRIFMQRFCLYEYHKIILKGKGNKIDHFYGNNFILSALSNPKIIQL